MPCYSRANYGYYLKWGNCLQKYMVAHFLPKEKEKRCTFVKECSLLFKVFALPLHIFCRTFPILPELALWRHIYSPHHIGFLRKIQFICKPFRNLFCCSDLTTEFPRCKSEALYTPIQKMIWLFSYSQRAYQATQKAFASWIRHTTHILQLATDCIANSHTNNFLRNSKSMRHMSVLFVLSIWSTVAIRKGEVACLEPNHL